MMRKILLVALIGACLAVLSACGSDDDSSTTPTDGSESSSEAGSADDGGDAAAGDDGGAADSGAAEDAGGDDPASSGGEADGDDLIGAILGDLGLTSDILGADERDCMNAELRANVGTLPSDLSLTNTDLWDQVNAAAETCGADIGL